VGHAFLGDVETRHDLDAADQQGRKRPGGLQHFPQHAVDAEADDKTLFFRFNVYVRGAVADALEQQGVDQTNDRGIVTAVQQVVDDGGLVGQRLQIVF
jgi:hypothetical protein